MLCNSASNNFSKYMQTTKFTESQIRQFFAYFKKFSNGRDDYLLFPEFKKSLGILGSKSGDFISDRLFNIISDHQSNKISFANYLQFMNLVNNGTSSEKLSHSFRFFDIEGRGYISKENFRVVILNLCEYFASVSSAQVKIREMDIDLLFEEILSKIGNDQIMKLDEATFKAKIGECPYLLDFYDIFNNKIQQRMLITIHKNQLDQIKGVLKLIKDLKNIIDTSNTIESNITISTKNFIENALQLQLQCKKLIPETKEKEKPITIKNNKCCDRCEMCSQCGKNKNITEANYFLKNYLEEEEDTETHSKMFGVANKIEKIVNDKDEDIIITENSSSNEEDDEDQHELVEEQQDAVLDLNNEQIRTTTDIKMNSKNLSQAKIYNTDINQEQSSPVVFQVMSTFSYDFTREFKFIAPVSDFKDKDYQEEMKENGVDLNNCLIITNRSAFINFMTEIQQTFNNIMNEVDPVKEKMINNRRIGWSQEAGEGTNLGEIINCPIVETDAEKGVIHFGNQNLELALNLMIGIRNAVSSVGSDITNLLNVNAKYGNSKKIIFPFSKNDDAYKEINRFEFDQNSFDSQVVKLNIFHT